MTQTIQLDTSEQLDQQRIEISGLFDTDFYLSKYPDIKKSKINALVHFVQYGAREYRWPNKHFDPLYYLKMIPQAYGENFLIHYIRLGRSWQIPTCASKPAEHWQIPELLAQPFRLILFFCLCLIYSFERQFSGFMFFRVAMLRFFQGCGSKVKLRVPSYLIQPKRLSEPQSYQAHVLKQPIALAYLYFANVLKVQGFFSDAKYLLNRLTKHTDIADLVLSSLGDLLLVEATWANEFRNYETEGIVLNLSPQWQGGSKKTTWHDSTFDQALAIIKKGLEANANNIDAQWLLGYGLLAARKYADALETFKKYPAQDSENIERNFLEARAIYGLDRNLGISRLHDFAKSGIETWNTADLEITNTADIPPSLLKEQVRVLGPIKLLIESKTIRNLELITCKNTLEFCESYLSSFKRADVLPEYGVLVADNKLFIRESCHVKQCHAPLFNSSIQEVTGDGILVFTNKAKSFPEENCIYIGHNNNFYHWLIDDLSRLRLIEIARSYNDSPILIDKKTADWQYELLSMLGIDKDRLRKVDFREPMSFRNLVVPSRMSRDMVAHPEAVSFMRKKLLSNTDSLHSAKGKRIYITRTADNTIGRTMLNQRNIIDKFKRNSFQIVDPAQLSIREQIELFSDADVIVGPVGAGLTNILFAPKQARVLSFGPDQFICETYTSLACAIGQESWSIRGNSFPRPYPNLIWTNFDYEISEKDIDFGFEHILD